MARFLTPEGLEKFMKEISGKNKAYRITAIE